MKLSLVLNWVAEIEFVVDSLFWDHWLNLYFFNGQEGIFSMPGILFFILRPFFCYGGEGINELQDVLTHSARAACWGPFKHISDIILGISVNSC